LTTVLARYPAISRPYRAPEALGNAGGGSGARLWRYQSGQGRLLARAWPHDGLGREGLEQIHRWLGESACVGFIPVPVAALDGRTLQEQGGRFWEVTPWLDGVAAPERPPSRSQLRSGFTALAAFHQALQSDRSRGPSPSLHARRRELDGLIRDGFDILHRVVDRVGEDPHRTPALQWLALARATAPAHVAPLQRAAAFEIALQPCLRDARPEHLLFTADRVTGLVDFGAMGVDSVAADLARLLGEWIGGNRLLRMEAMDAYAAIRPLDPVEVTLVDVFEDSAALLGAGHWVRWHFLEGRKFTNPSAVGEGIARGLERLAGREATLRRVLS
jgi:Ser/Thr protein kinase RdoA (MazF antagonist)